MFWSNYIEYESSVDRNRILSIEEYLSKCRPYLKDIINDLTKADTQKIQLPAAVNIVSHKETEEERVMHSKNDKIEIIINNKPDETR